MSMILKVKSIIPYDDDNIEYIDIENNINIIREKAFLKMVQYLFIFIIIII